jgi:hypothetical protein
LDNKWIQTFDLWFFEVEEGYIIKFFMEYTHYFSEAERKFAKVPRKTILEEIPLWIKMLFIEKGLICMELDKMAE